MTAMRLSQAAQALGASLQGEDVLFSSVSTDSRSIGKGELFVALNGDHFNGHEFVEDAFARGAAAAMVSEPVSAHGPLLHVEDTRQGLGELARLWRQEHDVTVIGVTGSNGKTTVKEMLATILKRQAPTLATRGNLNNDIGVPLTLFRLQESHRYAVIEMGANHIGEIAYLCQLAQPDVSILNNAAAAHLEGFGSLEGVVKAKGEIVQGLHDLGVAILNADDPSLSAWLDMAGSRRVITFGFHPKAQVRGEWQAVDGGGELTVMTQGHQAKVRLALPGKHNGANALAAIAAAQALDIQLDEAVAALSDVAPVQGRLQWSEAAPGIHLLDDTYNANPASLGAALAVLASSPGDHWLVLGDMGELGEQGKALHRAIGSQAAQAGVEHLFAVGPLSREAVASFPAHGRHFESQEDLLLALQQELRAPCTILIKGSRFMHMERVAQTLKQRLSGLRQGNGG